MSDMDIKLAYQVGDLSAKIRFLTNFNVKYLDADDRAYECSSTEINGDNTTYDQYASI